MSFLKELQAENVLKTFNINSFNIQFESIMNLNINQISNENIENIFKLTKSLISKIINGFKKIV